MFDLKDLSPELQSRIEQFEARIIELQKAEQERDELRAQVVALVEAGNAALDIVWAENAVAKREGNTQYEGVTKRAYDKLQAAIAAAEGRKNDRH